MKKVIQSHLYQVYRFTLLTFTAIAQICKGWQVCSSSSVQAGWTCWDWDLGSYGLCSPFFLRQVEAATLTWNARPQMKLVEREAAHARQSEVCTASLVMVDCSSRSSELHYAAIRWYMFFFPVRLGGTKMIRNIASQCLVTFQDIKKRCETTSGSGSCNECGSSVVQSD